MVESLRSGGKDLTRTAEYPEAFGKRVAYLHRNWMDLALDSTAFCILFLLAGPPCCPASYPADQGNRPSAWAEWLSIELVGPQGNCKCWVSGHWFGSTGTIYIMTFFWRGQNPTKSQKNPDFQPRGQNFTKSQKNPDFQPRGQNFTKSQKNLDFQPRGQNFTKSQKNLDFQPTSKQI